MKLGVLFNCQATGVAASLRLLRPDDDVVSFTYPQLVKSPAALSEAAMVLQGCDLVVASETPFALGPAAPAELRQKGVHVTAIPPILFGGFHPDACVPGPRTAEAGGMFHGPTGNMHSRISVAGFLAGLSAAETALLYNRLVFSRLGYFGHFGQERALLIGRFQDVAGYDLNPWFDGWMQSGCFMHSINHPLAHVLMDVARIACRLLDLPTNNLNRGRMPPDTLARLPKHPVFPDIASMLGIAPEPWFQLEAQNAQAASSVSLEDYLALCLKVYQAVPRSKLLGVTGIGESLHALGLAGQADLLPRRTAMISPAERAAL